jgi:AcrR family transcriptional regulator
MRPQRGKQKLFAAAINLFESQGYFATSIEQITIEAGVSKGLVYHYFKSKEELLESLITETTGTMKSVATTLDSDTSIDKSLSQFIDTFFDYLEGEKRFLKLQLTLMLMPELKMVVHGPMKQRADLLLQMLINWFQTAEVIEPENKGRLFLAMLDGIALHYLSTYDDYPLSSMKPQLIGMASHLCSKQN